MNQTFINLRLEKIEKRLDEINILIDLAENYQRNPDIYQALCRSAHVLLVSHFEGLYKEICKDIIDDINANTKFIEVNKDIFHTYCDYFVNSNDTSKSAHNARQRLWDAFKNYPSAIKVEPFLYVDNKNPTPEILKTILEKFGINDFFWGINGSDLDIVFENQKSKTLKLRNRLHFYIAKTTKSYPYTIDTSFYNPIDNTSIKRSKTLWEDFINNFLKERHNIIHGNTTDYTNSHESILEAKTKIEIIIFAFIINICSKANPLILI